MREDRAIVVESLPGPPRPVEMRFELAALRMADTWLSTGTVQVDAEDFRIAAEFLENAGYRLEQLPGLVVRVGYPDGETAEMPRESVVVLALRRLALREERRRRSEQHLALPQPPPEPESDPVPALTRWFRARPRTLLPLP